MTSPQDISACNSRPSCNFSAHATRCTEAWPRRAVGLQRSHTPCASRRSCRLCAPRIATRARGSHRELKEHAITAFRTTATQCTPPSTSCLRLVPYRRDGSFKIGDLGQAIAIKAWDDQEGDACYLSRDLLESRPSAAADIFSFGARRGGPLDCPVHSLKLPCQSSATAA
eukprot:6188434-Pleurochrysis_carterae.AAC.3